jgi:hypothetical protein
MIEIGDPNESESLVLGPVYVTNGIEIQPTPVTPDVAPFDEIVDGRPSYSDNDSIRIYYNLDRWIIELNTVSGAYEAYCISASMTPLGLDEWIVTFGEGDPVLTSNTPLVGAYPPADTVVEGKQGYVTSPQYDLPVWSDGTVWRTADGAELMFWDSIPNISGDTGIGSVLTCSEGSSNAGAVHSYDWYNNEGTVLQSGDSPTYTIQPLDDGFEIYCVVVRKNTTDLYRVSMMTPLVGPVTPPTLLTGLLAHWKLDEPSGAGSFVVDQFGETFTIVADGLWWSSSGNNFWNDGVHWYLEDASINILYISLDCPDTPYDADWEGDLTFSQIVASSDGIRYDSHGTYHLTDNNYVGRVGGVIGNAAYFNGENYLSGEDPVGTSFSLSVWLKPHDNDVYEWMECVGAFGQYNGDRYFVGTFNGNAATVIQIDGHGSVEMITSANIEDGEWHHIVLTFDGTTAITYVDGSESYVDEGFSGTLVGNGVELRIGNQGYNAPVVQNADSLSIWNRAITPEEVTALYNSGDGLDYENFNS